MRKAALAGVAALSIAGGALALAAVMPIGAALAQDTGSPTTTAAGAPPTAPAHPKANAPREGLAKRRDALRARFGAKAEDIATFLGLTVDDLTQQLRTKSLGEIAGAKKADLVAHLTSEVNLRVDQAMANGTITKERADKIKAATAGRVAKLVDAVRGGKAPLGRPGAKRGTPGR